MSTISNVSNSSVWGVQSNNQVSGTQEQSNGQPKIHHHHHKSKPEDLVQISNEGKQESTTKAKSPLDSLVSNETITQDQEDAIRNAFLSAKQANQTGTYTNQANPISSLVANGTITQTQADSVVDAFKSVAQSNQDNKQITGSKEHHGVHHHHHAQQSQNSSESSQSN